MFTTTYGLLKDIHVWPLVCMCTFFSGSLSYLTQPVGALLSGPVVDFCGRKRANFLVNIPHLVAWLLLYFSWDLPSLFIANGLLGLGTGIMEAPINSYVGEIR